jgi:NTE family protein
MVGSYRGLIEEILGYVGPDALAKIKQRPRYIELMGDGAPMSITRFLRPGQAGEPSSRDYDFSEASIQLNQSEGYALVKKTLGRG